MNTFPHRIICRVLLSVWCLYMSLPLHRCHCVKDNGCFTASTRCFLALICFHWFCSMHSRISFTCSVCCAGFHSPCVCLSNQLFISFLSSFLLCCRFTLCTWATITVWLLLWPHGFISNFCQESLQSNILSYFFVLKLTGNKKHYWVFVKLMKKMMRCRCTILCMA
jgi:hypothetical protein